MSEGESPQFTPVELRAAGMPVADIARRLGRDADDVEAEIREILREKHSGPAFTDEDRVTLDRYDTIIRTNWVKALGGDTKALNAVRNVEKDRAKLVADRVRKERPTGDQLMGRSLRDALRKNISGGRNDALESGDTRSTDRPTEEK